MSPTLRDGDVVFGVSLHLRPVRAGSIVAFRRHARRNGRLLIKRALTQESTGWFVIGDHPSRSSDSRRFGAVPTSDIQAVAVCRWSPAAGPDRSRFGWLL